MSSFELLKPYLDQMRKVHYLISVLYYDIATTTPSQSIEAENELLIDEFNHAAALSSDQKFIELLKKVQAEETDPKIQKLCKTLLKQSEFLSRIDPKLYESWNIAYQESNNAWRKAREEGKFDIWLPAWKKAVEAKRQWAMLKKDESMSTLYDACLDDYEPGMREGDIEAIFDQLKAFLLKALPLIQAKQGKRPEILPHNKIEQEALSYEAIKLVQYDLTKGALRESEHPFSDNLSRFDARITTHYYKHDWRSNLYSVIHESGHAIEFQNWSDEMYDYYLEGLATAAVCETHSRLFENIFGRSKGFMKVLLPAVQRSLKGETLSFTEDDLYRAVNYVEPSLIRTESDEFTYSLHIIIRHEIERDLINGVIECEDVPALWKQKYKTYLGVEPTDERSGCMQDVHWTDGAIGYFPSYALGNLYGAQIHHKMQQEFDVEAALAKADFKTIIDWLAKNDYAYDWMDPKDWLIQVTGEPLNVKYFIDYLSKKYLG